jgi:hypothetical protein
MKQSLATIIVYFIILNCCGQVIDSAHSNTHIFWQPELKITYNDYKGQPTNEVEEMMQKYNFSAAASVGIWSILDTPKNKRDRYKKFEKVYFAPAFEKTTSFSKTNDTLQIEMQNLYFDICEIWARWARKELRKLQDSTKATGTLTIFYMTVKEDMNKYRVLMYRSYFKEVFIDKTTGAFDKWKQDIDKILEETKEWATTRKECYRLMTKKPIEKGYIQAPTVFGSMSEK